ncbi:DNA modification methylase [Bacteroidales bacterium 6E]|nr:DNA modification methylase [Bacteroidales bacterium 6E]
MEKVHFVDLLSVSPNPTKLGIYQSAPENYASIKDNISQYGIIEPLLVNKDTKVIISGNLRHQIATELGFNKIPVIFVKVEDEDMDLKSISTNQQRIKSTYQILKEIQFFEQHYNIRQGARTDLDPELKEMKEHRDELFTSISRDKRTKIKKIHQLALDLYGEETPEYFEVFQTIDIGKTTLNGQYHNLLDKFQRKGNDEVIPQEYSIIRENTQIYNRNSADMSEVDDNSINTIITSPPYFQMRDYETEDQIGQERLVETYLNNLIAVFNECKRVLRQDGSLFVNINDCVIDGQYQAVPQRFLIKMIQSGWLFNDEMIWIKNNPAYTQGSRSVRSHEYIYHFTKSTEFFYSDSWLRELVDINNEVSYGTNRNSPKVKSGLDFRGNILKSNASSTAELRKKCAERGFHLTHSATFPIDVPSICGFTTTREGDTILDCFAGTSVTGEFARRNNRKFIGYELNPQYIIASEVRLSATVKNWNISEKLFFESKMTIDRVTTKMKLGFESEKKNFNSISKIFSDAVSILGKYN